LTLSSDTAYTVTVGAGGAAQAYVDLTPGSGDGNNGSNSVFDTLTSFGGGYGAGPLGIGVTPSSGGSGGSGGGGGGC
jgi:hypothetical protein